MSLTSKISAILDEHFPDPHSPGAAVMLYQENADPIFATRGKACLATKTSVTPCTTFRLASVAKQFTAATILQQIERRRLSLDQPVTDIFSDFAPYGRSITIEHLLRHTSGIKDYEKLIPEGQITPLTDADVLAIAAKQDASDFPPGSQFHYSNTGYAILAMIIEKTTGLSYPDYLRENIFDPIGMTDAIAFVDGPGKPQPPNRAIGYKLLPDGTYVWADQNITTAVLGDGGIYCSVSDYARWISAWFAHKIVNKSWVEQAHQPTQTTTGETVPYGYGWRLEPIEGKDKQWRPYHPGSTSGFRNGSIIDPHGAWAALALTNHCNGDAVALARAIAALVW